MAKSLAPPSHLDPTSHIYYILPPLIHPPLSTTRGQCPDPPSPQKPRENNSREPLKHFTVNSFCASINSNVIEQSSTTPL